MTSPEAFRIMGLGHTATRKEAKEAFRMYAMIRHPDRGGTAEQFRELKEAFDIVLEAIRTRESRPSVEVRVGPSSYTWASHWRFYATGNTSNAAPDFIQDDDFAPTFATGGGNV
jgi:DnaJ-class molecular chaperone